MKYKTVIFDLDGTLLDTLQDLADATNHALKVNNMPLRTIEEVRMFVGNGIGKLIERAVPKGTAVDLREKVLQDFTVFYKAHCKDTTGTYPGVMELLTALRAAGCKTAIVSNKADFAVQELAKEYFAGFLDAACGEQAGIARKPAPDMLLAVMKQLGADPATTVYVGDSDTDLLTAANTGVPCIGACWGFRGRDFLVAHGATILAERVEDVLELCK
ncbi:HAD family hydrolase [Phascolarctobacterium sp.]|uniref:HAD family hydrolase n=1 Tax=Phascolarctobacterium sp. TaxID=2049039 RepID=UPI00386A4CCC